MAGSKKSQSSDSDAAYGCLALIALGIVVSIISFVLEHWEFFVGTVLAVVGLVVAVKGLRAVVGRTAVGKELAREAEADRARKAGQVDMRTAWLEWQLGPAPTQRTNPESSAVPETLAVLPKAFWNITQLRTHGRAVWALREASQGTRFHQDVESRLDRVAAMISDLNDEEFDSARGQNNDQYLYHRDREVRAAYLEGGAKAVEAVLETISAARAQAREEAAARVAAESLAQQRNAALRAMRETPQSTETRDAHAAWDAQAREVADPPTRTGESSV